MAGSPPMPSEDELLAALARRFGPARAGELWSGDDAAILDLGPGPVVASTDVLVEGVHFTRATSTLADVAWKALAVNLSDLAAMAAIAHAALVTLSGASADDLAELTAGFADAAAALACPIVGGDLSAGRELVVGVAVLGRAGPAGLVRRDGAGPDQQLYVTGVLGSSAAGLRLLGADPAATGELVRAHRRPVPRTAAGLAAAAAGATAMLDCSDGLALDLDRLARASGVGIVLDEVPVAPGATEEEALGGGEDYELIFSADDPAAVAAAFAAAGLSPPIRIGRTCAPASRRVLRGKVLEVRGYQHRL